MNIADIESQLHDLIDQPFDPAEFPFAFLTIYDAAKATVTKLRQGAANQAKATGDVLLKNKLFFRASAKGSAADALDEISADPLTERHRPRFLIATDGVEVYARDLKADQTLDIAFGKLNDAFDFFLPLAGIERHEGVAENPADIKATGRLAKLYDAILECNSDWLAVHGTHELNLFMTRMLFCFFAEDTGIFSDGIFTSTVINLTKEDGSDTSLVLTTLYRAMNTPEGGRSEISDYARRFPYVNGGLFREDAAIPEFSKRARRLFRDCGDLHWREINPDIFGSMIQAVVEPGLRSDMGMHYTSVPNIMKVLQPLFLLSLEAEFEASRDSPARLKRLLQRIYNMRVFDPACGSGNFLIIAYRELRKIETRIFHRQQELDRQGLLPFSGVRLTQFYGIELADFAVETAKLSLWIAEYQLNRLFEATFGAAPPALPLSDSGNVTAANALLIDWDRAGPSEEGAEIYVIGNPPYLGTRNQSEAQKLDLQTVFKDASTTFRKLDYVSGWLFKAAQYARKRAASAAFVMTNSICQGEQVDLIWPLILQQNVEIGFAYTAFKWRNSAAANAGVTCVIVGLRPEQKRPKTLYEGDHLRQVSNISPYLFDGDNTIIRKRQRPISDLPNLSYGNYPGDGNFLTLTPEEAEDLTARYPVLATSIIRRLCGSQELLKGIDRYCLWIDDQYLEAALQVPEISERIDQVREVRTASRDPGYNRLAARSHQFRDRSVPVAHALAIPTVSSERRTHYPVALVDSQCVLNNQAFGAYDAPDYVLALVSSRLHTVWAITVGGALERRIRYSNTLVYNTFPVPALSQIQIDALDQAAFRLLEAREQFPGKTLAWLYDPETMPDSVRSALSDIDDVVENIYIGRRFVSDTERVEHLFKRYKSASQSKPSAKANKTTREVA
jgi:hypothetical protein